MRSIVPRKWDSTDVAYTKYTLFSHVQYCELNTDTCIHTNYKICCKFQNWSDHESNDTRKRAINNSLYQNSQDKHNFMWCCGNIGNGHLTSFNVN